MDRATDGNVVLRDGLGLTQVLHSLIIDSVSCQNLQSGVQLDFVCPCCGLKWSQTLLLGSDFPSVFDFNQLASFTVPQHGCVNSEATVSFFVAVHGDSGGVKICVQRGDAEGALGIPVDWWQAGEEQT